MICKDCSGNMRTTYVNKREGYTKRTRKCETCGKKIHTIEIDYEYYKSTMLKLQQIEKIFKA